MLAVQRLRCTILLKKKMYTGYIVKFNNNIIQYNKIRNSYSCSGNFYPTALKVCQGIVFTHGVRMGMHSVGQALGRREKVCPGCISETVRCRKLILQGSRLHHLSMLTVQYFRFGHKFQLSVRPDGFLCRNCFLLQK